MTPTERIERALAHGKQYSAESHKAVRAALREAVAALDGIRRNEAYPVPRSLDWHHEDVLRADAALARIADILSPDEVKP